MTRLSLVTALAALVPLAACGGPAVPPAQNYAIVFGRVFDASTNAGVAGAIVTVDVVNAITTGPDGSYSVSNVPIGQTDVVVAPPAGYGAAQPAPFSVTPGERFQLDIPLSRTP
jgi:predicted small lipoprotein YifL